MQDGAITTFGNDDLVHKYRADRVEMWLRGAITTDVMEKFLEVNKE